MSSCDEERSDSETGGGEIMMFLHGTLRVLLFSRQFRHELAFFGRQGRFVTLSFFGWNCLQGLTVAFNRGRLRYGDRNPCLLGQPLRRDTPGATSKF